MEEFQSRLWVMRVQRKSILETLRKHVNCGGTETRLGVEVIGREKEERSKQEEGQGDRQTDRQTETDRERKRDRDKKTERERNRQTDRETEEQRDRDRDRQTDRDTDTQTKGVMGWGVGGCIVFERRILQSLPLKQNKQQLNEGTNRNKLCLKDLTTWLIFCKHRSL